MKEELITREGKLVKELEKVRAEIQKADSKPRSRYRRMGDMYHSLPSANMSHGSGVVFSLDCKYYDAEGFCPRDAEDITRSDFLAAWEAFLTHVNSLVV